MAAFLALLVVGAFLGAIAGGGALLFGYPVLNCVVAGVIVTVLVPVAFVVSAVISGTIEGIRKGSRD